MDLHQFKSILSQLRVAMDTIPQSELDVALKESGLIVEKRGVGLQEIIFTHHHRIEDLIFEFQEHDLISTDMNPEDIDFFKAKLEREWSDLGLELEFGYRDNLIDYVRRQAR